MRSNVGSHFTDQRILMDGKSFRGCRFERCELVFAGVGSVEFTENVLSSCRFSFDGPARNALNIFAAVANMIPAEHRDTFVRGVLNAHRPKHVGGV